MRHLSIFPAIPQASNSLERYLHELRNLPLITAEEEIQLARRIRAGDEEALEQLVRANLRFVVSVAKQYQNTYLSLMDLISEGNIGLVQAARRFDETRGFKFISYAVWWIRKAILAFIAEHSRLIRLPVERIELLRAFRQSRTRLEQQLAREPTLEELAAAMNLPIATLQEIWTLRSRHTSLYASLELDKDNCYLDFLENQKVKMPDEDLLDDLSLSPVIEQRLHSLSKREQRIIRMYYGAPLLPCSLDGKLPTEPMSYEEIGKRIGLCAERVRLLKQRALLKLRLEFGLV
jgi:RNA polymerase primary sigma factor